MINYAPAWEAASKQIDVLQAALYGTRTTRVVGFNTRGKLLHLNGTTRVLPAPLLLAPRRLVRGLIGSFDIHHVFASAGERHMLPRFAGDRAVLSIAKQNRPERLEGNVHNLRRFRYVIVETHQDRELLRQCGLDGDAVQLIFPGAQVKPYRPASGPFTIVYATAPLGSGDLLSRGVHLLAHVAKSLPDVRFVLAWRNSNLAAAQRLLRDVGTKNVEIRNGVLNMDEVYAESHATILPGLHRYSLKPCPQSILDSLGHGKPVLVSRLLGIAPRLERSGTAVLFEPAVDALREAIIHLRDDYDTYQRQCHPMVRKLFSEEEYVKRHFRLYDSLD